MDRCDSRGCDGVEEVAHRGQGINAGGEIAGGLCLGFGDAAASGAG